MAGEPDASDIRPPGESPPQPGPTEELRRPGPVSVLSLSALRDNLPAPQPPPAPDPSAPFPSIPGYRIVGEIGRGGMGVVYEAVDTRLNRAVALKLVSDVLTPDAAIRSRLADEAEAVARLAHPNVVRIYQLGDHHGRPFMALELVRGGNLGERLAGGPLEVGHAVDLMRVVARAIQHAHDRGVIHRDLKPGNILLDCETGAGPAGAGPAPADDTTAVTAVRPHPPGVPKVTDFGIAKILDQDRGRTRTGMFMGTLLYIAPELVDNSRGASPASDVYSLGVILYECLTGRVPLSGKTFLETLHLIQTVDPPPPSRLRAGLPRGLDAVCRRALAKAPADRYPTAAALAADLDRVAAGRRVRGWVADHARPVGRFVVRLAVPLLVLATLGGWAYREQHRSVEDAARDARELLARGEYVEAEAAAGRGLRRTAWLPGTGGLAAELAGQVHAARRGRLSGELHRLIEQLRFGYDGDTLDAASLRAVVAACDDLWAARDQLKPGVGADLDPTLETQLRTDLLDLALLSADLRARGGTDDARRAAAARLKEAEQLLGANPALTRVRESIRPDPRTTPPADALPTSTWELYALGRHLLIAGKTDGDVAAAAALLQRAVDREPAAFWPNFYLALAFLRQDKPGEAVISFTTCLAVTESRRGLCFYNRAVARERLGELAAAEADLDRALSHEPKLAAALFRRGVVRHKLGKPVDAVADLKGALALGSAPAAVWYHIALARRAANDPAGAVEAAAEAVKFDPADNRARELLRELSPGRPSHRSDSSRHQ